MPPQPKGKDLFFVDNSLLGWTGLRDLEEWAGIAKAFNIATGFFEIGSLRCRDGNWQDLDRNRVKAVLAYPGRAANCRCFQS